MSIVIRNSAGQCLHTEEKILETIGVEIPNDYLKTSTFRDLEIEISEWADLPGYPGFHYRIVDVGVAFKSEKEVVEVSCQFLGIPVPHLEYVQNDGGWILLAEGKKKFYTKDGKTLVQTEGMVYHEIFTDTPPTKGSDRYILFKEHDWNLPYRERIETTKKIAVKYDSERNDYIIPEGFEWRLDQYGRRSLYNIETNMQWSWAV